MNLDFQHKLCNFLALHSEDVGSEIILTFCWLIFPKPKSEDGKPPSSVSSYYRLWEQMLFLFGKNYSNLSVVTHQNINFENRDFFFSIMFSLMYSAPNFLPHSGKISKYVLKE